MTSYPGGHNSSYDQSDSRANNSEHPYVVRLTPSVHSKLVQFFNRSENLGLRQSDVIDQLLSATELPPNIRNQRTPAPTFVSPPSKRQRATPSMPVLTPSTTPKRSARLAAIAGSGRVIARFGHEADDEEEEEEEKGEDQEDNEEVDADEEEMLYGDEYMFEEDEEPEPPPPPVRRLASATAVAVTPSKEISSMHNYYADARKRLVAIEERPRRSEGSPRSSSSQRKQYHPDRKGIGTGKQKPWTSNLRRYLYEIIVKWQRDDSLHCRECDRWMKVVHKSSGLRCGNALDHVCSHLGKPMYACRLCTQQTLTQVQMRKHLKQVHQRTNDFDDLTDSFYNELSERIQRCFDYTNFGEPPTGVRRLLTCKRVPGIAALKKEFLSQQADMESSSIRQFIYLLIEKWQKENTIYCRTCHHWVRLGSETPWAQTQAALAHICGHNGMMLYVCLICGERTITANQMARHIRNVHQEISRGNCSDEIDDYQADLKEWAAKCFDWDEGTEPPQLTADGPFLKQKRKGKQQADADSADEDQPSSPRKRKGSCRLEAFDYAHRLIRELPRKSSKMECRRCNMVVVVKTDKRAPRPEVIFNHVLSHIDTHGYACRLCDETKKRCENMRMHVMVKHKELKPTDYIDKTGEIKDEVFDMIKKCFEDSKDDNETANETGDSGHE